jgi:hypothetical protein
MLPHTDKFKAWSQNLGREEVLSTFRSCSAVGRARQSEMIRDLAKAQQAEPDVMEIAEAVARGLRSSAVSKISESRVNKSGPFSG